MRCFPEPYTHSKSKIKVELNLSKFAAKSDFDTSDMAKKADLANKLDIGKLKNILVDLSKLSDLVKK